MKTRLLILLCLSMTLSLTANGGKRFVDQLPRISEAPANFSRDSLMSRMNEVALHHIEGVWLFTSDGTEIAIIRPAENIGEPTHYNILLLNSANRALRPGTMIGAVSAAAGKGYYNARLYTRVTGSKFHSPKNFVLKLDEDDARLVFETKKSTFSLNLWRLLPYMWRYTVRRNQDRKSVEGCVRVYPRPSTPINPQYL